MPVKHAKRRERLLLGDRAFMPSIRIVLVPFPLSPQGAVAACVSFLALMTAAGCGGRTFDVAPLTDDAGTPPHERADGGKPAPDAGSTTKHDAASRPPGADAALPDASIGLFPPDGSSSGGCTADSDCGGGGKCSFASSVGQCRVSQNPVGQCLPPGPLCGSISREAIACGCNGQDIVWEYGCNGVSSAYVPADVAHTGACADAALPVIGCVDDAMCPEGLQCGYDISEGCSATGHCVGPGALGGTCQCAGVPACACDGTTELLSCCALFASKPVASRGACAGDSGSVP